MAAQLGLFSKPVIEEWDAAQGRTEYTGGFSYFISYKQLEHRSATGCLWCRFLLSTVLGTVNLESKQSIIPLKITMGSPDEHNTVHHATDTQKLLIAITGYRHRAYFEGYVHTAAGVCFYAPLLVTEMQIICSINR